MDPNTLILLKNCNIFSPDPLGINDILIGDSTILVIDSKIEDYPKKKTVVMDIQGATVIPGLIDGHVHIAGAGGEGGPSTRTPEISNDLLIEAGITTVVGCLGTDGITRDVKEVLMKAKKLKAAGFSAWIYTGSYQVPVPTITGSIARDLAIIEEVIGVGEVAVSDHRSSHPTTDELIRLASETRVGGMLGGKSGIINLHMGDAKSPFDPVYKVIDQSELGFQQFLPTHCNRNSYIYEDAKIYGKKGWVDITTSAYPFFPDIEVKPSTAIIGLIDAGVPVNHITMTSDANGSLPDFDEYGQLIKLEIGKPISILNEIRDLIKIGMPVETAVRFATINVATILQLKRKGKIAEGNDADILVLDDKNQIVKLFANGKLIS